MELLELPIRKTNLSGLVRELGLEQSSILSLVRRSLARAVMFEKTCVDAGE